MLTAFNFYSTDVVSIHEVYPGHYVQFSAFECFARQQSGKKFSEATLHRGWAHYCEKMLVDEGYARSQADRSRRKTGRKIPTRPSRRSDVRDAGFVSRSKMHTQQMTVEEATNFSQDNCYMKRNRRTRKRCRHYRPGLSHIRSENCRFEIAR